MRSIASSAREAFRDLTNLHVSPFLKSKRFSRRGHHFARNVEKNVEAILITTWNERNTDSRIIFTVDFGILSRRVFWFETDHDPVPKFPDPILNVCHWMDRLGRLVPDRTDRFGDYWWAVDTQAERISIEEEPFMALEVHPTAHIGALGSRLANVLENHALPLMDQFARDESLRDSWLAGRCHGINDFLRLKYLSILLLEIGPQSELARILTELREEVKGSLTERVAEYHLAKIESRLR